MAWIFIILIFVCCGIGIALDLTIQIVAPERTTTATNLRSAISKGTSVVNGGRFNRLRSSNIYVEAGIFFIDNQFPSPGQMTDFYCDEVFLKNASAIMSINYNQLTSTASKYIENTAIWLGMPVISWDPFFTGALEVSHFSYILHHH